MLELLQDNFYEKILKCDIYCGLSVTSVIPFSHYYYFTTSFLLIIANNVQIWSSLLQYKELDSAFRPIRIG